MRTAAIIAAAGIGRRMGSDLPKQYLALKGRPIICHTLDRFCEACWIDEVVIVVEPGRDATFRQDIIEHFGYPNTWKVVSGGDVRQRSVANGLAALQGEYDVILVHDGVRPFITAEQIKRLSEIAKEKGACILASPIKETVKRVSGENVILGTVDRSELWSAETPQAFRGELIVRAMEKAFSDGFVGTDEASLVERIGTTVSILPGDGRNIKITTPADIKIAEAIASI